MPWSERQAAMLHEMGIRLWQPPSPGPGSAVQQAPETAAAVEVIEPRPIAAATPALGDLASLGWDELREAVVACTACGLCKGRRQTVFGVGHQRAQWMIVGEAPGEQEDIQGEPFVGKSGQLLDNMLRAIGLGRAQPQGVDADAAAARQVYIANTIKCRPPGNRNPEPEELARCEPFLIRQLQLVQPKIILAMGRFAVQSLLRSSEPIGRLRGRVHQYQGCLLYTSPSPRDRTRSRMPSSA